MTSENNDGGMITKIWGPPMWETLHTITFDYPNDPSDEVKAGYKQLFESLKYTLPCIYCRKSYAKLISTGNTKLTDAVFKDRNSLTKWLYDVHETVNKKLGVNYGVTYEDIVKKYESYRANCKSKELPNDNKKGCTRQKSEKINPFKVASNKECVIIPYDIAKEFYNYAKKRGVVDEEFNIMRKCCTDKKMEETKNDKKIWDVRNAECSEIFNDMRINGKPSLEIEGEYKGLPTVDELKLLLRLSSNLSKEELTTVAKKIKETVSYKTYKLIRD